MSEIKLLVQRFNPMIEPKPHFAEYSVPVREGMTVLDALLYARDYIDHSIALRFSCRQASCGSCGMKINGKAALACYTQLAELKGEKVLAQPMDNFAIIKDLVTDFESFFEKHKSLTPHLVRADTQEVDNPTGEFVMSQEELEKVLQFTYCIKCGICTSSCPNNSTDSLYPGPQAIAQAFRYTMDVRDEGGSQRIEALDTTHGIWRCHFAGSCSSLCPKGVDPALGIQLMRRHVLSGKPPRKSGEGAKVWKPSAPADSQGSGVPPDEGSPSK